MTWRRQVLKDEEHPSFGGVWGSPFGNVEISCQAEARDLTGGGHPGLHARQVGRK